MNQRMIIRVAIAAALLAITGTAAATGVTLPSKANSHATDATATVTTGTSNDQGDQGPAATPNPSASPNEHAAFGQCVAANAQTASDNGGQGWNPTVGCDNTNASTNGSANSQAPAQTGTANAQTHANSHASAGLQKAGAGANNAPSH